ncbi:MAG: FAD:protein FMN transferase, partial [Planctomycetes bacterium]|nr:FAD:protein FMN transferase [Planctomycetota bacterium]
MRAMKSPQLEEPVPEQKTERPHHRNSWLFPVGLVLALGLFLFADRLFFPPPPTAVEVQREMMDTWVSITVYDRSPDKAKEAIDAAFSRMKQVVLSTSIYDKTAEAYRLNANGKLDNPSDDLWTVIAAAKKYYTITKKTFDITVEPLLELWRDTDAEGKHLWEVDPETRQARIDQALKLVGADRIILATTPSRTIALPSGMRITLGGIAKGYAVDQGLAELRNQGIEHAMINAGGDIGVFGGKPDHKKWEIALRNPKKEDDVLVRFVISDGAIATSGNYERYFDKKAQVGHIMDPRTGYSSHASSSASVIAPTCMEADALATATFVLGPTEGITVVDSLPGVE